MYPQEAQFARLFWNQLAPKFLELGGMDIRKTDPMYIGSLDKEKRKAELGSGSPLPAYGDRQFDARTAFMK